MTTMTDMWNEYREACICGCVSQFELDVLKEVFFAGAMSFNVVGSHAAEMAREDGFEHFRHIQQEMLFYMSGRKNKRIFHGIGPVRRAQSQHKGERADPE